MTILHIMKFILQWLVNYAAILGLTFFITITILYIFGSHCRRKDEIDKFVKTNTVINDNDANRVIETIKAYQDLGTKLEDTIQNVNGIVKQFNPPIPYIVTNDCDYFKYLYEYSKISVLRVDKHGNLECYNNAVKDVFAKLISLYTLPVDDIIKTVITKKLFEIFGFDKIDVEDIKTVTPAKTITLDGIPDMMRISVIFEYDIYGVITHFNFFVTNLGSLGNFEDSLIHIELSNDISYNRQEVEDIKKQQISKMLDYAKNKGIELCNAEHVETSMVKNI